MLTIKDNKIFNTDTNESIRDLCIICDFNEDVIVHWGNEDIVNCHYNNYVSTMRNYGIYKLPFNPDLLTWTFLKLTGFTKVQQYYIVNRMINYTATGFVKQFGQMITKDNCMEWLNQQMKDVII